MANHAFGTVLTWDGENVASLTSINGVEVTVDTIDVSNHESANAYKEYLPGLIDPGQITLEGQFEYTDTAGQHAMITDLNARSSKTWTITFPTATGATWTGTGFLTALKIGDATIDGAITFTCTIQITGKPTFAVATVVGMSAIGFDNDVLIMPAFDIGTFEYVVTITNGQTATVVNI